MWVFNHKSYHLEGFEDLIFENPHETRRFLT